MDGCFGILTPQTTGIYAIHITESRGIILLTNDGLILGTDDGGDGWNQIGTLPEVREQLTMFRLDVTKDHRLWVLGRAGGLEGTQSVIAKKGSNSSWTNYMLDGFYLRDMALISDQMAVACGFMITGEESTRQRGVILYSTDGPQSWTIAYENAQSAIINSLSVSDSHIWAVGENGLTLRHPFASKDVLPPTRM